MMNCSETTWLNEDGLEICCIEWTPDVVEFEYKFLFYLSHALADKQQIEEFYRDKIDLLTEHKNGSLSYF